MLRLAVGGNALLLRQRLPLGGLPAQVGGTVFQRVQLLPGLVRLLVQGVQLPQGTVQLVDVPLQRGDKPGFVVAAAVQLLFQSVTGLGVGRVLLAGGDQRGDAAFQLRVLLHRQGILPDERTALKDLAGHAQQRLSGVLSGDVGDGRSGAGIGAGELAHGGGGAARLPQQRVALPVGGDIHAPLQRRAVPRGIAVLVRQRTALTGGQTVQHGADERAPCGLAGFVRCIQQVQPRRERQLVVIQTAKGAGQVQNIHGVFLL